MFDVFDRPRSREASGLVDLGEARALKAPIIPTDRLLPREVERLGMSAEDFFLSRMILKVLALPGCEVPREEADLPLREPALIGELPVDHVCCDKVGEVFRRGRDGLAGTGRGFINLSVGFIVRYSELVELTLSFLERPLLKANGTFKTLTSCPGSIGQEVVDGSAEL